MNRRQFLKLGAGLALASSIMLPEVFMPQAHAEQFDLGFDLTTGVRTVDLYRPATGEQLSIEYLRDGVWVNDAYSRLCWFLRDVKANKWVQMDPTLIAILDWTQHYLRQFGYTAPLHILSGYRTPQTNNATEGAARNSQHMFGRAVDFTVPGLPAEYLGRLMAWLSQGGVGIYESSSFVHVDTGRIRLWRGHPHVKRAS